MARWIAISLHPQDRCITASAVDSMTSDMTVTGWRYEACKWSHLRDIDFHMIADNSSVDILIGLKQLDLQFYQDRGGRGGEPSARLTPID